MTLSRRIAGVSLVLIAAIALGGCAHVPSGPDPSNLPAPRFESKTTMKKIADQGSVKIGVSLDQPLMSLEDAEGVPQGFDIEIARLVAHSLGLVETEITWVPVTTANRVQAIEARDVDFVVSAFTITPERLANINFGGPYYAAGQTIMVNDGDTAISGANDLLGRLVCTDAGSTSSQELASLQAEVVLKDTLSECLAPLRSGVVDAISSDNVLLEGFRTTNPGQFNIVGAPFALQPYGVGIRRDDLPFRDFIDDVLEESYADGTYKAAWEATAGKSLGFVSPPKITRQ